MLFECLTIAFGAHLITTHNLPEGHRLNEVNPGLYARCDNNAVGTFRNSHDRQSVYATHQFNAARLHPTLHRFELSLGGITGYAKASVLPFAALQYKTQDGYRLAFIPSTKFNQGSIHVTTEF